MIRPEIAALILRGHVQIDEVYPLACSREESTALIPALTNEAVALRLGRTLAKMKPPASKELQNLAFLSIEVIRRLEGEPPTLVAYSNQDLAQVIGQTLAELPIPANPLIAESYEEALYLLTQNSALRLQGGL